MEDLEISFYMGIVVGVIAVVAAVWILLHRR